MSSILDAPSAAHAVLCETAPLAEPLAEESPPPAKPKALFRLGEQLLRAKFISANELEAALDLQSAKGLKIGEALLELGVVSEEELAPFVEQQLGCPAVRLREGMIDPKVVSVIPRQIAEALEVLPLFLVRGTLTTAMSDPQDLVKIDELESRTGLTIRPVFAFAHAIRRTLARAYEENFQVDEVTADLDAQAVELTTESIDADMASVEKLVDGSPVINLVNYLILQAIHKGASDIHVEPGRKFTFVRFRIDGQLVEMLRPRRDIHSAIVSRIKVMGKMDIAEQRAPQDGRCQVVVDRQEVDLRISTLPTVLGEKAVLRVLDRRRVTFHLDELGIPQDLLAQIKKLLGRPYGLLLVTGPTGSGKTTTLYSALELIKSVHRNVVTVEDPVEYQLELINQVQVDAARTMSFARSLRAILRQDPDVIMVGEIRDPETASAAVQAALTGHLVLSTLHTNDSAGAVTRLLDMGLDSFKVAAALIGVVAQRLVRKVCPKCRGVFYPPADLLDALGYQGDRRRSFVRGEGCRQCYDTGFQGRLGVYEVLSIDPVVREMISRQQSQETIRSCFVREGNATLLQSGLRLADQEITSLDEVARVAFCE